MRRFAHRAVFVSLLVCLHGAYTSAQDFLIYTRVYDESQANSQTRERPPIISRSSTYFHAGKVYDSSGNPGEITVFEPAHSRFTLLSTARMIAAQAEFAELKQLVKVAEQATRDVLDDASLAAKWDFEFHEEYDAVSRTLRLENKRTRYEVQCEDIPSPDFVNVYLRYADWMARLNYVLVLDPQLHPGPRLALDESLRRRKQMPLNVRLQSSLDSTRRLRAEHTIYWQLGDRDRTIIGRWEKLLKDPAVTYVTLREYQATVLGAKDPRNRSR